jgi:cellulose synthase operon protein C
MSALHSRTGGQLALAAALVGTSLFASVLIVPNVRERAVMHLRDREFDQARAAFERRLEESGPLLDTVVPLARLYAQRGELDRAISIISDLIAAGRVEGHEAAEARRLMSTYLRWAGREAEHRANLLEIVRLEPTPENLRELSSLYNFAGETDAQIEILRRLIALPDASPDDFVDLAELFASRRAFSSAIETLAALVSRMPERFDSAMLDLWLIASLEAGDNDGAQSRARAHLARRSAPPDVAAVIGAFSGYRLPRLGIAALEPIASRIGPDSLTNLALMRLALDAEDAALAGDLFDRQLANGVSAYTPVQLGDLIDVGLAAGREEAALTLARSVDLAALTSAQIGSLAGQALDRRQTEFLRVIAGVAGPERLGERPVLAARIYLALDDNARAAAQARRALASTDLPLEDALTLVQIFAGVDMPGDALGLLSRLAENPALPETAIGDLAQLYLLLKRAPEGVVVFERLRQQRPTSLVVATGWALVMAQAGRGDAVARWLGSGAPDALPGPVLTDLFFIGGDANSPALQLAAARRLRALEGPTPIARLRLAQAALAAGQAGEALVEARALRPLLANEEVEALYRTSLALAASRDPRLQAELRGYWRARLADTSLVPASREEALYALIDARAWDDVLPELARRARSAPAEWLGAFVTAAADAKRIDLAVPVLLEVARRPDLAPATRAEATFALIERTPPAVHLPALRRAAAELGGEWTDALEAALERGGLRDELLALLTRRAADTALTAEAQRAIAFRLLDLSAKPAALAIFQRLAGGMPAQSPDAQQTLFLMGPRPEAAQLGWIEAQARAASGATRIDWVRALIDAGAPRRAASILEADAAVPGRVGGPATLLAAEAYLAAGTPADLTAFARLLAARIPREGDPANARRLAELGAAGNRADLARQGYERLFLLDPAQRDAQRQVGFFAFADGDFERARALVSRYLAGAAPGAPADWEAHYYLGESLYRLKERAAARIEHEHALAAIDALSPAPFAARSVQAYLYHRLGRSEDSVALYGRLLREQPRNRDLRADYAGVLLELGRTNLARSVLGAGT